MRPDPVQMPATALVLQGGGARGAYQVGALRAIAQITGRRKSPFPIVCGSSVGAINAAPLAASAADFGNGVRHLEALWRSLRSSSIYDTSTRSLMMSGARWAATIMLGHLGVRPPASLLDNSPLARLLERELDPNAIDRAIACGALQALCITISSYDESKAISFFQAHDAIKGWSRARRRGEPTRLSAAHLMASSALPFVFPPVALEGCYYGDGSLRLTSPLSPAIHTGADRILVIAARDDQPDEKPMRAHSGPSVGEVAGHALDILFNDNLDADHERLSRINQTLSLLDDEALRETPLRRIESLMLSPSRDLRHIAAEHATEMPMAIRLLMRTIGSWGSDGRLISYLLFEPGYIGALIDLGHADTMARADEIRAFLGARTPALRA